MEGNDCKQVADWRLSLEENGFVTIPNALRNEEVEHLRLECNLLSSALTSEQLERQDCVIDLMASCPMREDAIERVDCNAFSTIRKKQFLLSGKHTPLESWRTWEALVFSKLPSILNTLITCSFLYFFNDHYITKPPQSDSEFSWHRDDEKQLAMVPFWESIRPYFSVWCALDSITAENGAIKLLPISKTPPKFDYGTFEQLSIIPSKIDSGTIVIFRSDVWHASFPNQTHSFRRVYYVQYSLDPITSSQSVSEPLNFAIPCTTPSSSN
uniref:Uncharacterized protein AlNc14C71G4894 n=1 Tax=Albugo laibachii Nc14 TaxID=890382 RepID=F0WE33_9STRA|nr:conserved hypothetical protein [Albugo laibachii Nc14]|eukprot:CCA19462.1 conserved hypothetical protein [Albugo laibachii Nc14]